MAELERPFRFVPDSISTETVEALEEMLIQARQGRLIGIAFAGMWKERAYFTNAAGECRRNPTFARGMVATLDDQLGKWIGSPHS